MRRSDRAPAGDLAKRGGRGVAARLLATIPVASLIALVAIRGSFTGASNEPVESPRLWRVPEFSFGDQLQREVSTATLGGRPYVASFFFSRCPSVCPVLTSRITELQRRTKGEDIAFVSFSLDPEHDRVDVLRDFAEAWNPGEARWSLVPTEPATLRHALDAFRVTARKSGDPADPILHGGELFLVDAQGFVRGIYASDDPRELETLTADLHALAPRTEQPR